MTMRLCLVSSKQNLPCGPEACSVNPGCTMSLRNVEAFPCSERLHVISTYLLCVGDELIEYDRTTLAPPTISLKVRNWPGRGVNNSPGGSANRNVFTLCVCGTICSSRRSIAFAAVAGESAGKEPIVADSSLIAF